MLRAAYGLRFDSALPLPELLPTDGLAAPANPLATFASLVRGIGALSGERDAS